MYLPHRFGGESRPHACGEICIIPGLMFQLYILCLGLTERVVISNLTLYLVFSYKILINKTKLLGIGSERIINSHIHRFHIKK